MAYTSLKEQCPHFKRRHTSVWVVKQGSERQDASSSESSLVPRPYPVCISILKAIHAGVGFGSRTETTESVYTSERK